MITPNREILDCLWHTAADSEELDRVENEIGVLQDQRDRLRRRVAWAGRVNEVVDGVPLCRHEYGDDRQFMDISQPDAFPYTAAHLYDCANSRGVVGGQLPWPHLPPRRLRRVLQHLGRRLRSSLRPPDR